MEGISSVVRVNPPARESTITCFRCGVCCTRYQPPVTLAEAETIATALGISLNAFLDMYIDDSWPGSEYYLLDTYDEACVFLEYDRGSKVASCRIHSLRPQACKEWAASLSRKECQEGLVRYWGLAVSSSGQLEGTKQRVRDFQRFLKSLVSRSPFQSQIDNLQ